MDDKVSKCEYCEYFVEDGAGGSLCRCQDNCALRDDIRDAYESLVDAICDLTKQHSMLEMLVQEKVVQIKLRQFFELNRLRTD